MPDSLLVRIRLSAFVACAIREQGTDEPSCSYSIKSSERSPTAWFPFRTNPWGSTESNFSLSSATLFHEPAALFLQRTEGRHRSSRRIRIRSWRRSGVRRAPRKVTRTATRTFSCGSMHCFLFFDTWRSHGACSTHLLSAFTVLYRLRRFDGGLIHRSPRMGG